ncbi:MAG: sulfur carrier protein ThiS [Dehalococcoidia bacterium]|nr:sulfur carrier protein ThiS [Dehalococcoidia bacterium]
MSSITLNGKPHEIDRPQPVTELLAALSVNPKQVAVALNGEVIPRRDWAETRVNGGDTVEIVRAVGGG